jgi:formate hydrogenlyase subunit 6/NADH:ubiquinone oxidoreductase subunit I
MTAIPIIWRGVWGLVKGLWVTMGENIRTWVKGPVTVQYGYAPRWSKTAKRPVAPRYRGRLVLLRDAASGELRCTACGICAQTCPGKCLAVQGENRRVTSYVVELDRCLYCGLCVEACPFEAVGMLQDGAPLTDTRAAQHLDIAMLAQPVGAKAPGITPSMAGNELRPGKKAFVPKA